jgi:UDP-GlcNAc:undecaprenyl-phosphate/decaprenyl-phosphate GlcNAc-1-phosphate transferase
VAMVAQLIIVHNTAFVQLGPLVGGGQPVYLNQLSIPFTIFALVGLINAINLSDGLDGLAGGLSAIALAFFSGIAWLLGFPNALALGLATLGAALGFLIFNIRHPWQQRARVFMGDSGSLVLGLILGVLSFKLTQRPVGTGMPPVLALWILAVPLIDTVTVLLRRIAAGRNPLKADQQHLHHIILRAGFSHAQTVWIILGVAAGLAALAVLAWKIGVSDAKLMFAFMLLAIGYFTATSFFYRRLAPAQDIGTR